MFKKPFKVKQNSQLSESEIRKTCCEILKSFPQLHESDLLDLIPHKEIVNSTKLVTHSGESVTVFSVQKLPIVFVVENVLFPTVYLLWKFPNLLPVFTTSSELLPKLCSGANLILPGVVFRQLSLIIYTKLKKGTRVAINLTNNKAVIAVGVTAFSSYDMYLAAKLGKAVKIHHIAGDHLWVLGTALPLPELGPPGDLEEEAGYVDAAICTTKPVQVETESEVYGSTLPAENIENTFETHLGDISVAALGECQKIPLPYKDDSAKEMDELLLCCFLKAWETSAKKVELPILASNFYRLHMLPACPMGKSINLKISSYKKLSTFLKAMQNTGIIRVKKLTKDVENIIYVDYVHNILKEFVDTNTRAETACKEEAISKTYVKPEIMEMCAVTAAVLPMFAFYVYKKGDKLSATDIRKRVTEYMKTNNLQNTSDKNMVNLDPLLKTILQRPDEDSVKWEDLMSIFLDRMSHSYQVSFAGESTVMSKGKLKTIDMQVERRANGKKVTLVNNLETYKISLQEFAKQCQHGAAARTSIYIVSGSKSRQLLIQGNQVLFVANLLIEKYKIPEHYITGFEHAPKKKVRGNNSISWL